MNLFHVWFSFLRPLPPIVFFFQITIRTISLFFLEYVNNCSKYGKWHGNIYNISYPLFADAYTGNYPHAASQCHARLKSKRGFAMLSVDKFPYPLKQTKGNEFITCSNDVCHILKHFCSFKILAIPFLDRIDVYTHCKAYSVASQQLWM